MSKGFRIGSLLGFPIRVHLSFLALLAIVLVFMEATLYNVKLLFGFVTGSAAIRAALAEAPVAGHG